MINYEEPDNTTALEAMFEAQKIAFGPIVFQATKALRDLGILNLILEAQDRGATISQLVEGSDISKYGIKVLVAAGMSAKLIRPIEDRFTLTKVGKLFLCNDLTRVNMNFVNDVCYQGMFKLQDSIKDKRPSGLEVFGNWATVYEGLSQLPEPIQKSWFEFDHFYSDGVFEKALPIVFSENPKKIMDIGANTGKFSTQCLEYSDDVQLLMVDLPGQLKVAEANLESLGLSPRVTSFPTDLLENENQLPQGADVIWMSQFLDCFSEEEIVSLLRRAYDAMSPDSSLFILETYVDRQEHEAAAFSLHNTSLYFTAIANGTSKMYFSHEMIGLIQEAGLIVVEEFEDVGDYHTLFKCQRASYPKQ